MFRLFKWIIILGLIIGLYFFYPKILKAIGNYLIIDDPLKKSDVILVLSGDRKGERLIEGVKLFKKGYGKYLVLSGNEIGYDTYASDIMEKQAISLKVPKSAIIPIRVEGNSTIEEAQSVQKFFNKKDDFKSMILVTSSYHTRRAKWVFSKVFKETNIKISAHPSEDSEYDPDHWWEKRTSAKHLFYEYTKLLWYKTVERLNLDSQKKDKSDQTSVGRKSRLSVWE